MNDSLDDLNKEIEQLRNQLLNHRLYRQIVDEKSLQIFMSQHIICVWDFMSLLKHMQSKLCPSGYPWVPPRFPEAARLVNEIICGEESDTLIDGTAGSHFELYLSAMKEMNVDTAAIEMFVLSVRDGQDIWSAIHKSAMSDAAKKFVQSTLSFLEKPIHVVAAVFYYSREDLLPGVFTEIVKRLKSSGIKADGLLYYLERHIEVDSNEHGPKALSLLDQLFVGSEEYRLEALEASIEALRQRLTLWEGISTMIDSTLVTESLAQSSSLKLSQKM